MSGDNYIPISNYFKCKWIKCSFQKTQGGSVDKEARPLYMLPARDPLQVERHTQTENERIGRGISCKWK